MTDAVLSWQSALELFPVHEVMTDEGIVTCREGGLGDAIVFVHGISSGSGSWIHQLVHFAESARCVAWDAPGYGSSVALQAASPTAAQYAERLRRFLDALGIGQALFVAHSLGALMATAFAAQHGDRVRAMVLLDPAIGYGDAPPEVAEQKLSARLKHLSELGIEGLAKTRAHALVSSDAPAEAIDLIRWNMRRLLPAGYVQAAHMLSHSDLLRDAACCSNRVLVASGAADTITPPDACRRVAAAFPNAHYDLLPGLGHASYVENPVMVNRRLAEFRKMTGHG